MSELPAGLAHGDARRAGLMVRRRHALEVRTDTLDAARSRGCRRRTWGRLDHGHQDRSRTWPSTGSAVRRVPPGAVPGRRSGILERTLPVALVPPCDDLEPGHVQPSYLMPASTPAALPGVLRSTQSRLLRDCRNAGTTVRHHRACLGCMRSDAPVPPLDEQRRIVDILEDHLSRLDAAHGAAALDARQRRNRRLAGGSLTERSRRLGGIRAAMPVGQLGRTRHRCDPAHQSASSLRREPSIRRRPSILATAQMERALLESDV